MPEEVASADSLNQDELAGIVKEPSKCEGRKSEAPHDEAEGIVIEDIDATVPKGGHPSESP